MLRLLLSLALFATVWVVTPAASALSPCPMTDFALRYEDDTATSLSATQLETVHAAINRLRQCPINRIDIFPASPELALWEERAAILRAELIAQGIPEAAIVISATQTSGVMPIEEPRNAIVAVVSWAW